MEEAEQPMWSASTFLLTETELRENLFPLIDTIPEESRHEWIQLKRKEGTHQTPEEEGQPKEHLVAIDCEMVREWDGQRSSHICSVLPRKVQS